MAAAATEASNITSTDPTGAQVDAQAFKKLYPRQFFDTFFNQGIRPDGRTLARGRPWTIGVGVITNTAGSCLAKLGATTVLAGVKATVGEAPEGQPNAGTLKANVELAPFATADFTSPASQELLSKLTCRLQAVLQTLQIESQLGIKEGKAAYHMQLDVYILNADGSELDAVLVATIASLLSCQLPAIKEDKEGRITAADQSSSEDQKRLKLQQIPLSVTCGLLPTHILVDPTSEEQAVCQGSVCTVLDGEGQLHGVYQTGGGVVGTPMTFIRCFEASKLIYAETMEVLMDQLQQHGVPMADDQHDMQQ